MIKPQKEKKNETDRDKIKREFICKDKFWCNTTLKQCKQSLFLFYYLKEHFNFSIKVSFNYVFLPIALFSMCLEV